MNASALHFSAKMLNEAKHPYELTPAKETYVTVDAAVAGTGNDSCGFKTLKEYRVNQKQYTYNILPITQDIEKMKQAKLYQADTIVADTTKAIELKKVSSVKVKNAGKNKLTIQWKKQKSAKYVVAYSTSKKKLQKLKNGTVEAVSGTKVKSASANKITLKGLKKNTTYYVKVCAYQKDESGTTYSKYSATVKFKTKNSF